MRKALFDLIRTLLGRPIRDDEISQIDAAIDAVVEAERDLPQDSVPCVPSCRIGPDGIRLIQDFEGIGRVRADGLIEAYPDPGTGGEPWTIGWGSTGPGIGPGTVWTREQADERFAADLERYAAEVADAIGDARTSQPQFDALVSFHYNTGAIRRATLTRKHKAGDYEGAAREFARWNQAGGRVLKGLVRRRAAEERLYRSGM